MDPLPPTTPPQPRPRLVTLTLELSNTRTDRGGRPRNRTESYVLGLTHPAGASSPLFDPFSLACYRALLLGSPTAIIRATLRPSGRKLLTEPLGPQPLAGEDVVEPRASNRVCLLFRLYTHQSKTGQKRFFGCRGSDARFPSQTPWLNYRPEEVIFDRATGAPPTFADAADYARKAKALAGGNPPTKTQAWSTWLWLLAHATFCPDTTPPSPADPGGRVALIPWSNEGAYFSRTVTTTAGR